MTRQQIASASAKAACSNGGRGESTPVVTRQQIASASLTKRSSGGSAEFTPAETHSGRSAPKKRINSRSKGARGELTFAKALTDAGFPATRGQQHAGGADSPDVRCEALAFVHFEIKVYSECQMTRPAQIRDWEAQARRDAGPEKLPVIAHKWLRSDWWVRVLPTSGRAPYWQTLGEFLADVTGSGRVT